MGVIQKETVSEFRLNVTHEEFMTLIRLVDSEHRLLYRWLHGEMYLEDLPDTAWALEALKKLRSGYEN